MVLDARSASSGWRAFAASIERVNAPIYEEISARRGAGDLAERDDIMSLLLQATHEDGSPMGDEELRDELVTLLVAGHETTANALAWAASGCAATPTSSTAWPRRCARETGPYLQAVIQETLRLRPVISIVLRRLVEPMEIGGRMLPAGVSIAPSIHLVHRRADIYPSRTSSAPSASSRRRGAEGAGHIHVDPVRRRRAPLPGRGVRPVRDGGRAARARAAPHARPGAARLRALLPARDHRDAGARRRGARSGAGRPHMPGARHGRRRSRAPAGSRAARARPGRSQAAPREAAARAGRRPDARQNARRRRGRRCCARPRDVICELGLDGASIDGIAAEAGYTKGAFYANFASKEEMFLAMLDEKFAPSSSASERRWPASRRAVDVARRAAEDFLSYVDRDPEWPRLYQEFAVHAARNEAFRAEFATHQRALRARMAEMFARWARALGIEPALPHADLAAMAFFMADGFLLDRIIDPQLDDGLYASMCEVFLRGIAATATEAPPR